jgi:hypothetical protein
MTLLMGLIRDERAEKKRGSFVSSFLYLYNGAWVGLVWSLIPLGGRCFRRGCDGRWRYGTGFAFGGVPSYGQAKP